MVRHAMSGEMFDAVDLFAGPGGWSVAVSELGLSEVGIEWDAAACATRAAASHRTVRADVSQYPTDPFRGRVRGLIASPPCPAFSAAGKGHGRELVDVLAGHVHRGEWAARPHPDPEVWLVLDVGRWATELLPEWIALEQVPAVEPIWHAYEHALRPLGYSTWCGVLNAADYGVPQTRQRAILIASRVRSVAPPPPTHDRDPMPSLFDPLAPWVTMGDALGWVGRVGFPRLDDTGTSPDGYRERDWRSTDEPAGTLTEKARSWILNTGRDWKPGGTREDAQQIGSDQPAPAVTGQAGAWHLIAASRRTNPIVRSSEEPAQTLAFGHAAGDWVFTRPATTLACDPRIWPPGHKINQGDIDRLGEAEAQDRYGDRAGTDAIRLSIADALTLQSFPAGYPVQGSKSKQFEQIGNAVPPLLARHILTAVQGGL